MKVEFDSILRILERFAEGRSADADVKVFNEWLKTANQEEYQEVLEYYQSLLEGREINNVYDAVSLAKIESRIDEYEVRKTGRLRYLKGSMYKVAAIVILICSVTIYWNAYHRKESREINNKTYTGDVTPGGNRAVLTLADGTVITLDNAKNGTLAKEGNTSIRKAGDGRIAYHTVPSGKTEHAELLNTLSTPRGGQYQIVLPDKSKVWLNAQSSITFPSAFTGKERRVSISGEAYFEIAENKNKPFFVKTEEVQIEVLGTHFNVRAYKDDNLIKTSLVEGAVKLSSNTASALIRPGYGASISHGGGRFSVAPANLKADVAWKEGVFRFDNADMKDVLRQISRWYDVEIVFQGEFSPHEFVGEVDRTTNLSEVLKILELGGDVRFDIQGKKVIVKPA